MIKRHHLKTQWWFFPVQLSQTDKFNDARLKRVVLNKHRGWKTNDGSCCTQHEGHRKPDSLSSFVGVVNSGLSSAAVSRLMWVFYSPSFFKSSRNIQQYSQYTAVPSVQFGCLAGERCLLRYTVHLFWVATTYLLFYKRNNVPQWVCMITTPHKSALHI